MEEKKEEVVTPEGKNGKKEKKKGGKKKLLITLAIIVVVLVVAGAGVWKWHEQPSFCGTVCHKVMATYVEDWQSGNGLANAHKTAATATGTLVEGVSYPEGVKCLDCHEPTIGQQVQEVVTYISGDYQTPLEFRDIGTSDFCERCHNYDAVIATTENWGGEEGVNPHSSHNGKLECFNCHRVHEQSTLYCNQCHDWEVPQGWTGAE